MWKIHTRANVLTCPLISGILMLCSACSQLSVSREQSALETPEGKHVGSIHYAASQQADIHSVQVYRIPKGYALKANLEHDTEAKRKGDVVLSRSKDYGWFAGLEWRFRF